MFYSFIRIVARIIVFLINGNAHYLNKEKLPSGNYILVGPHRAWFDMIYFALGAAPKNSLLWQKKNYLKIQFSAIYLYTPMLFLLIVKIQDHRLSKHPLIG